MNKISIKRFLAMALVLMSVTLLLCSCGSGSSDPWDYSKTAPADELIGTDPAKILFTGKEWKGKLFQRDANNNIVNQSDIVSINALDYHTVGTVVFDSVEKALEASRNYDRTNSKYYKLLTGKNNTWKLAVYKNEDDANEAGVLNDFYKTDYNMSKAPIWEGEDRIYSYDDVYYGGFKDVTLPASWQTQGFDFPIYTNTVYPWDENAYGNEKLFPPNAPTVTNPVGFYRYEFNVDPDWMAENRRVYISFGGVESAYYVYVNGYEVGYSEDSFDATDFDITPYLYTDDRANLLAVKVYRWCDGSYFENQDFIRLAGIFRKEISVQNEHRFTDLAPYDFKYELVRNGVVVDTGSFDVSCKPMETVKVTLPIEFPTNVAPNSEYLLNVYACLKEATDWAEAGSVVAYEQLEVDIKSENTSFDIASLSDVTASDSDKTLTVTGDGFEIVFDKSKGYITKYTVNGEDIFETGPVPSYSRGKLSNDTIWDPTLDGTKVSKIESFDYEVSADSKSVTVTQRIKLTSNNGFEDMVYTIYGGGQIKVECALEMADRIKQTVKHGNVIVLSADYEQMTYYGRGPADTFRDRKRGSLAGVYTQTVSDSFFPYCKPQDTGNKTDIRYLSLTSDKKNTGILIVADGLIEASALHYSVNDLNNAKTVYALPEVTKTYLNVDYGSRGVGGASCGPDTLEQYKLMNDGSKFEYSYTIVPFAKGNVDIDELAGKWRNR